MRSRPGRRAWSAPARPARRAGRRRRRSRPGRRPPRRRARRRGRSARRRAARARRAVARPRRASCACSPGSTSTRGLERLESGRVQPATAVSVTQEAAGRRRAASRPRRRAARADERRVLARGRRAQSIRVPGGSSRSASSAGNARAAASSQARDDRVGQLLVDRLCARRAARRTSRGPRERAVALDPLPRGGRIGLQPRNHVAIERRAHALGQHAPTAEGDRLAGGALEQRPDHRLLATAELALTLGGEEVRDRHPELRLEQLVRVHHVEPGRQGGPQRPGLAGAHEPDEDEGPAGRNRG